MKSLNRIDKAAFRKGEYIGYCNGAQRIHKRGGMWQTYALASPSGEFIQLYASTLREMNKLLEQHANQPTINMNIHWQQGGYTTIKNNDGQYSFKGTTDEEIKTHVADLDLKRNRIVRETTALMDYINGETKSDPKAIR